MNWWLTTIDRTNTKRGRSYTARELQLMTEPELDHGFRVWLDAHQRRLFRMVMEQRCTPGCLAALADECECVCGGVWHGELWEIV